MKAYIKGYNLFDWTNYTANNNPSLSFDGGVLSVTNNSSSTSQIDFEISAPTGTYTISHESTIIVYYYVDNGDGYGKAASTTGGIPSTFTTTSSSSKVRIRIFGSANSVTKLIKMQVNKGDTPKPYDNGRIRVKPVIRVENPKNLFDKSQIQAVYDDFLQCHDYSLSEDGNVLIATGNAGEGQKDFVWFTGWVSPSSYAVNRTGTGVMELKAGDTVTVSADFTLIKQGSRSAKVRCYLYGKGNSGNKTPAIAKPISATKTRYSWTFQVTVDNQYHPVFPINSNRVQIENILITKDGDTNYYAPQKLNIFIKE